MSGIRTNSDGSVALVVGSVAKLTGTADGVYMDRVRLSGAISSGFVPLSVPSWATKVTLNYYGVTASASGSLFASLYNAGVRLLTGYDSIIGYTLNTNQAGSVALTTGMFLASSIGMGDTTKATVTFEKFGPMWVMTGRGNRQDGVFWSYHGIVSCASLTQLDIRHSVGNITGGTFDAIFE